MFEPEPGLFLANRAPPAPRTNRNIEAKSKMVNLGTSPSLHVVAQDRAILRGPDRPDLLRDEVLSEIFAATAAARPDHPALVFEERTWTYGEVARRTDMFAQALMARGIGPGDVVGLWMRRGADLLMAQIAVTKAGAAWLPVDAEAPAERVVLSLSDAEAKALVADGCLTEPEMPCPTLTIDMLEAGGSEPVPARAPGLTPDSPAYLIYTSGSTGTPKGIVVSHRNICHFLRSANELYGIDGDRRRLPGRLGRLRPVDGGDLDPLSGRRHPHRGEPHHAGRSGRARRTPWQTAGVTVLDTVPTLLGLIPRDLPTIRLILLGGEALPAPLVERWATAGRRLFNTYGPTEATVVATAAEMRKGERGHHRPADRQLHLLCGRRASPCCPRTRPGNC